MNLPNRLTMARILLTPAVCLCMYAQTGRLWIAAALFAAAALTDFADGRIARRRGLITDFGKFMDPVADKLLVLCPMILFVGLGRLPAWMCALFVAREMAVSGFRLVAALKDCVIAADRLGKYKTTCQITAVLLLMLLPEGVGRTAALTATGIALVLTVWSGAECMYKNRSVITDM